MKYALPKNGGTTSGRIVLIQCRCLNVRNSGIIVTHCGSIIVLSMNQNSAPARAIPHTPGHTRRASNSTAFR